MDLVLGGHPGFPAREDTPRWPSRRSPSVSPGSPRARTPQRRQRVNRVLRSGFPAREDTPKTIVLPPAPRPRVPRARGHPTRLFFPSSPSIPGSPRARTPRQHEPWAVVEAAGFPAREDTPTRRWDKTSSISRVPRARGHPAATGCDSGPGSPRQYHPLGRLEGLRWAGGYGVSKAFSCESWSA